MNEINKKYAFLSKSEHDASHAVDRGKRTFISGLVGASGLAVAPGVMLYQTAAAKPAEQAVSNAVRWGMLVNVNQCAEDCDDCVTACND